MLLSTVLGGTWIGNKDWRESQKKAQEEAAENFHKKYGPDASMYYTDWRHHGRSEYRTIAMPFVHQAEAEQEFLLNIKRWKENNSLTPEQQAAIMRLENTYIPVMRRYWKEHENLDWVSLLKEIKQNPGSVPEEYKEYQQLKSELL